MKKALNVIAFILLIGALVFVSYMAITTLHDLHDEKATYDNVAKEYVKDKEKEPISIKDSTGDKIVPPDIDHDGLLKKNEDYIAWIRYESLGIDLPIVQGDDDIYYLKHNFNKEYAANGTIFIHSENNKDFSDPHTMMFGHNMLNDTMFGSLFKLQDPEYAKDKDTFWISTKNGSYRCHVFCVKEIPAVDPTYMFFEGYCEEYTDYLKAAKDSSEVEFPTTPGPKDRIVTLSTCARDGRDNRRVVVQAVIENIIY